MITLISEDILNNKKDLVKVSERTKTLKIACALSKEDAVNIMKHCRTLQEIIFDRKSFFQTEDDAKEYLSKWVYLERE